MLEARASETGYLHGYSEEEQNRLYSQARFLEPYIYDGVDYSTAGEILEVGCGVGAQTDILLKRFPHLRVTAIDNEPSQIERANIYLLPHRKAGRAQALLADARHLPLPDGKFDGAFLCWVLEHTPEPSRVLEEVNRVTRPGAVVYCTEVLNAPIALIPEIPAISRYWNTYNEHQSSIGGDPNLGARLGGYLADAGFKSVEMRPLCYHLDKRFSKAERAAFSDYWKSLFLSAAPGLKSAGRVSEGEIDEMRAGFEFIKKDPAAIFFLVAMQAKAMR